MGILITLILLSGILLAIIIACIVRYIKFKRFMREVFKLCQETDIHIAISSFEKDGDVSYLKSICMDKNYYITNKWSAFYMLYNEEPSKNEILFSLKPLSLDGQFSIYFIQKLNNRF